MCYKILYSFWCNIIKKFNFNFSIIFYFKGNIILDDNYKPIRDDNYYNTLVKNKKKKHVCGYPYQQAAFWDKI